MKRRVIRRKRPLRRRRAKKPKRRNGMAEEYTRNRVEDGKVILNRIVTIEVKKDKQLTRYRERKQVLREQIVRLQRELVELQAIIDNLSVA